jgi:hypothetical protein
MTPYRSGRRSLCRKAGRSIDSGRQSVARRQCPSHLCGTECALSHPVPRRTAHRMKCPAYVNRLRTIRDGKREGEKARIRDSSKVRPRDRRLLCVFRERRRRLTRVGAACQQCTGQKEGGAEKSPVLSADGGRQTVELVMGRKLSRWETTISLAAIRAPRATTTPLPRAPTVMCGGD